MFITIPVLAYGEGRRGACCDQRHKVTGACLTCTHHVSDLQVSIGEDYGIGGRGNGQHEGEGCAQCARHHDVQGVDLNGLRL